MAVYRLDQNAPERHETAWVAETASVIGNVIMAKESSVWFGATVRGDNEPIKLGARSNIQDGAVCHSDPGSPLTIGEDVTVGHLAMIHGCTIGKVVKTLSDEQAARVKMGAMVYVANSKRFRDGLERID